MHGATTVSNRRFRVITYLISQIPNPHEEVCERSKDATESLLAGYRSALELLQECCAGGAGKRDDESPRGRGPDSTSNTIPEPSGILPDNLV